MKTGDKNRAIALGVRIGLVFLIAVAVLILAAYYVLSENVHTLLTSYTIKLIEAMVDQGVISVENELQAGRAEAEILADYFAKNDDLADSEIRFPQNLIRPDVLRAVYISESGLTSSDGRKLDIRSRQDVRSAFEGESTFYGPYFNEENEYVICYTAPVKEDSAVVGVLSIEKSGYRFCELIEGIQFVDSGESYIINAEGTDIAVSDQEHIDWVNSQYNARELLEKKEDATTRSILELEQRGLNGESGVGTYYWDEGLCYVVYSPISSAGWVFLAGIREEELAQMTQDTLFTSISNGPTLAVCMIVFLLLTGLIVFWIISNTKKNAEINEKLEFIANRDSLTGLPNRRFLENRLTRMWEYPIKVSGQAAVFMMDIDNFKRYNDCYGHPQGDECLRCVANIIKHIFEGCGGEVIRYGGEEFVAVAFLLDQSAAIELGRNICRMVEDEGMPDADGGAVTISVGVCHVNTTLDASLKQCIELADKALYQAKKNGKNRAELLTAEKEKA